jgi:tRNA dimethylallyltransferase
VRQLRPSPLVVITGPTAVGKSALALDLAERFDAEIISADSRQVYAGMSIGTAAPTPADMQRVPHYLVGHVEPDEPYDIARFAREVDASLEAIWARGRAALLVGGSYHYIRTVVDRLALPSVPPSASLRNRLEREAEVIGAAALHARLAEIDPAAAATILPGNLRRTVRALEVIELTGRPFSEQSRSRGPARLALRLALTCERGELYRRIDDRVDTMLSDGWAEEVRSLLERGFGAELPSMSGSGYRELVAHLRGEISLDEAAQLARYSTHAFARRQYTWFRRDALLHWVERGPDLYSRAEGLVRDYLSNGEDGG